MCHEMLTFGCGMATAVLSRQRPGPPAHGPHVHNERESHEGRGDLARKEREGGKRHSGE